MASCVCALPSPVPRPTDALLQIRILSDVAAADAERLTTKPRRTRRRPRLWRPTR